VFKLVYVAIAARTMKKAKDRMKSVNQTIPMSIRTRKEDERLTADG